MVAAAFVCSFLGWQALLHFGQTRFSASAGEEATRRLGLPLLGRIRDRRETGSAAPAEMRAFTHLLRQRVPEAGATILFAPVHGGAEVSHLLRDAAICFAGRNEKVLILDAVLPTTASEAGDKSPRGLSDYLAFNDVEIESLIRKTEADGVDILSGKAWTRPRPDALCAPTACDN